MPLDPRSTADSGFPAARWAWLAALLLATALFVAPAFADPPARVGRVAGVQGGVWFHSAGSGEWLGAVRNLPVTSGDRVSVDADGRVELRVGSTALRLDAGSDLEVLQLDDEVLRVQLHRGSAAVRLRSADAVREFELLTDDSRFTAAQPGRFRIDHGEGYDRVTAWSGEALFQAPGVAVPVLAGERIDLSRDPGGRAATALRAEPARDDFFAWVARMDRADDSASAAAARYVSPEMTGAEDLVDRYGRWETHAEYGPVWLPYGVAAGWAPYRHGRWTWVAPWGWTWVDDAPWGFAPFHYGRWVSIGERWAWSPGRQVARPVYAPALVAWAGAGGVSAWAGTAATPTVGWFPLGPREVYVPGYRASPHYVRELNRGQVPDRANMHRYLDDPDFAARQGYMHRGAPGAWTVVPADVVSGRQPVGRAWLPPAPGFAASGEGRLPRHGEAPPPPRSALAPGVRGPLPGAIPGRPGGPDMGPTGAPGVIAVPPAPGARPDQPGVPPWARARDDRARGVAPPDGQRWSGQPAPQDAQRLHEQRQRAFEMQQQRAAEMQRLQEQQQRVQQSRAQEQQRAQDQLRIQQSRLQEQQRAQDQQRLQEQLRQQEQLQLMQSRQQEQQRHADQQRLQEQRRQLPPVQLPGGRIDRGPGGGDPREIHMRREPRDARDR